MAPQHAAPVTFSITNLTYVPKVNLTLEQLSSNEINATKSVGSKKAGNFFKLIESKQYLLSGQPDTILNGTRADMTHIYKTLVVWAIVDDKVYQIRYSAQASEYSNYIPIVFYISFRLL